MELSVLVYRLTQDFPREEAYGLTDQMRRAVVSIPSNIAEGQGRNSTGEFRQMLGVARGSNSELQTQIEIARALHFGNSDLLDQAEGLTHGIGKMLFSLLESLKANSR
jgi:four helix bundle protein